MSKKLKKALAALALVVFGAATLSINFTDTSKYEIHVEKYKVRAGDTFWDVSRYYRDLDARNLYIFEYQDELRELNAWLIDRHNQLQIGDEITVQYMRFKETSND